MIDKPVPNGAEAMLEEVAAALMRLELQRGFPTQEVELPPRDHERWTVWRRVAKQAIVTYTSALEGRPHVYLSTSCQHGEHGYCQANTGAQGDKIPGVCKFCHVKCVCPCHLDVPGTTPAEEPLTTGGPDDWCAVDPPGGMGAQWTAPDGTTGVWGDCDCTKPVGHEGDHACEPCTKRHGAPTWPQEPEDDRIQRSLPPEMQREIFRRLRETTPPPPEQA